MEQRWRRRISSSFRNFRNRRVASVDNLFDESAKLQNRAQSFHNLNHWCDFRDDAPALTAGHEEQTVIAFGAYPSWEELTQVMLVFPIDMSEFECRVATIKNAILVTMNEEDARDMRKYDLVHRRNAVCHELLNTNIIKAARKLGVLSC